MLIYVVCMCDVISTLLSFFFFFKQKTAYEMRISDWSSDVCSSDLAAQSKSGIGVVDVEQAMVKSAAFSNAMTSMQTTYKAQIDAFSARKATLDKELQTKATEIQNAQKTAGANSATRSEEHTSELQSLMRISYAVFCLKKNKKHTRKKKDKQT